VLSKGLKARDLTEFGRRQAAAAGEQRQASRWQPSARKQRPVTGFLVGGLSRPWSAAGSPGRLEDDRPVERAARRFESIEEAIPAGRAGEARLQVRTIAAGRPVLTTSDSKNRA
jgi:hypothetical protein